MSTLSFHGPIPSVRLALFALLACITALLASRSAQASDDQTLRLLGQQLFLDTSLSQDGKESCASCHKPDGAFSDGRRVAVGIHNAEGTRNTPSLLSLSSSPFFWDGRVAELTSVVLQPFTNPAEMGLPTNDQLLNKIRRNRYYRVAFGQAFPSSSSSPTLEQTAQALAAYVGSLNQGSNAYDYYRSGDETVLSPEAARGLSLFAGPAHCVECHKIEGNPAPFTDQAFHSTLIDPKVAERLPAAAVDVLNQALGSGALNAQIESDPVVSALGRFLVTHDPTDIGAFRTPSLRNVALTAPYMHDGSVPTLREAVNREIYYRSLQTNQPNTLTEQDRRDLVAFLEALTDQPRHNALEDRLGYQLLMN